MYLKKVIAKKVFCCHLEVHSRKEQDPDPYLLVRGTDPKVQSLFERQETGSFFKFWSISMLPDLHSEYGSGSRTAK
jgi:hypothetical protein